MEVEVGGSRHQVSCMEAGPDTVHPFCYVGKRQTNKQKGQRENQPYVYDTQNTL
jgi:hypothetical protein